MEENVIPEACNLFPGQPFRPMLGRNSMNCSDIKNKIGQGKLAGEYKYDGIRAVLHKQKDGNIIIFDRNESDISEEYSNIVDLLKTNIKAVDFIIDSEIVSINSATNTLVPFKISSEKGIDYGCIVFDILYLNGEDVTEKPLEVRRNLLHSIIQVSEMKLFFPTSKDANSPEDLKDVFEDAIKNHAEGLMVKNLSSNYQIGKISNYWLKMKKDCFNFESDSQPSHKSLDTIDAVVIGAFNGGGRRQGMLAMFVVGVFNDETQNYEELCLVGCGLNDQSLKEANDALRSLIVEAKPSNVRCEEREGMIFISPSVVWEIKGASIIKAPKEAAKGFDGDSNGLTLRFPRFLRNRPDKRAEEATKSKQLVEMFKGTA